MVLELAAGRAVHKPWGKSDLRPWSNLGGSGAPVGEVWFQRGDSAAPEPELLLKLLFTDQALSIQVHPDDAFARAIGLPHGKTEAWYVLAAKPGAEVSLGLNQSLSPAELRRAIVDGTIADLVHHQVVHPEDSIVVSAGTIHAIGAGLVIAEVQQSSDATFRLFDFGRNRDLHVDAAVGAAIAGPAAEQANSRRLSAARLVVATSPYFVVEQIDLEPRSHWEIDADREVWVLLLEGDLSFDGMNVVRGEAVFISAQRVEVRAGPDKVRALMAYVASDAVPGLLQGPIHEVDDPALAPPAKVSKPDGPPPRLATNRGVRV